MSEAAKRAYMAWQEARGVPHGPLEDHGWSILGPVPQQRWEAVVAAVRAADREAFAQLADSWMGDDSEDWGGEVMRSCGTQLADLLREER